jgi:hypothetical protein
MFIEDWLKNITFGDASERIEPIKQRKIIKIVKLFRQ